MKKTVLTLALAALLTSTVFAEPQTLKENEVEDIVIKIHDEAQQGGYELLSVNALNQMIASKENFVLIDAHPKAQFDSAFIDGASNFEFQGTFTHKWHDDAPGGSQEAFKTLLGDNLNRKVVVYCGGNKCGRSNTAALWSKELGYHHVFRVSSGIAGWQDAGFAVKTNQK